MGQPGAVQAHVRLTARIAAAQTNSALFAEENPYIGPTLDRLDETTLVLNDELNTPAANPAPAPASTPTGTTVTPGAAKCTLKATSNKVLLAALKGKPKKGEARVKPGTLTLTVKCNQAGKVQLTGTLTQLIGARPKHGKQKTRTYKLGPVKGTVKAGRALMLTVKLPVAAVTALGNGGKESATFTVVETGAGGAVSATAKIAALTAIR